LAARRRREPATWAVFGAILGPAALALLSAAPPGRCWSCAAPTEGWLTQCPWCGEDVREPVPLVPVAPVEAVRTHGPLTVIEGTAPRAPRPATTRADERSAVGSDVNRSPVSLRDMASRGASTRVTVQAPHSVESAPRERRIDIGSPPLVEQARRVSAATSAAATAAAASATVEAAADPVRRLKASLGRSTQSSVAATAHVTAPAIEFGPAVEPRSVVLASAIYVTGSRGLQAGSRYGIAISGDELQILGPVDVNPSAVAIRHAMRGMDATGLQGRLIVTATDGRRDQLALVFMSVAGGSPEGVADAIVEAARERRAESR
jgi:hypothetical protein